MRYPATFAAVFALSFLGGCAGLQLPALGGKDEATSALHSFLTDPNCAHDDEAEFIAGAAGIPSSFRAKVARHCEARPAPVTVLTPTP